MLSWQFFSASGDENGIPVGPGERHLECITSLQDAAWRLGADDGYWRCRMRHDPSQGRARYANPEPLSHWRQDLSNCLGSRPAWRHQLAACKRRPSKHGKSQLHGLVQNTVANWVYRKRGEF